MYYNGTHVDDYLNQLPQDRLEPMNRLRNLILKHLPKGFEEGINYGQISYFVPHSLYPKGYHCTPSDPLPFLGIASQKNFIALYHMGMYADPKLSNWFIEQYPLHAKTKLDMGKSCIRFKKMNDIPYDLIEQLVSKMTVQDWIALYEYNYVK